MVRRFRVAGAVATVFIVLLSAPAASVAQTVPDPTITWSGLGDGSSWGDPLNWDQLRTPGPGDHVRIPDVSGTSSVVHTDGQTDIASLASDEVFELVSGTMSFAGASPLLRAAAPLRIYNATVSGAQIEMIGGAELVMGDREGLYGPTEATFRAVSVVGTVRIEGLNRKRLNLVGGFSVTGQVTVTGSHWLVSLESQRIDGNATWVWGPFAENGGLFLEPGTALTVGPDVRIERGQIRETPYASNSELDSTFVNEGWLVAETGSKLDVGTDVFINRGHVEVVGGWMTLLPQGSNDPFQDEGTVSLASGQLRFGGNVTTARLPTIRRTGGTLILEGNIDNTGAVLALPNQPAPPLLRARVTGGRMADTHGVDFTVDQWATLTAVTLDGQLVADQGHVHIHGGLQLNGSVDLLPIGKLTSYGNQTIGGEGHIQFVPVDNVTPTMELKIAAGSTLRLEADLRVAGGHVGRCTSVQTGGPGCADAPPVLNVLGTVTVERHAEPTRMYSPVINDGVFTVEPHGLAIVDEMFENRGVFELKTGSSVRVLDAFRTDGTFLYEVGPRDLSSALYVETTAELAGDLGLTTADSYSPQVGESHPLIGGYQARVGDFDTVSGLDGPAGVDYELFSYQNGQSVHVVEEPAPADPSSDGESDGTGTDEGTTDGGTPTENPSPDQGQTSTGVARIGGADRIETAVAVSQTTFDPGVSNVFIVTAWDWPDGLAAGPAADQFSSPILLTSAGALPSMTAQELVRLQPRRITVVGGPAVIHDPVISELARYTTGTVTRIAGPTRFETAARLSAATFNKGTSTAFVATGGAFPDALAGGAAGAILNGPVLLVGRSHTPETTLNELRRLQPTQIVLLGGYGAVDQAVEAELAAIAPVTRLAGMDRAGTAAQTANWTRETVDTVLVATGHNFPDALAAGPLAGRYSAPLLLVNQHDIPTATRRMLDLYKPARIVLLGGPGAIGPDVELQLQQHLR